MASEIELERDAVVIDRVAVELAEGRGAVEGFEQDGKPAPVRVRPAILQADLGAHPGAPVRLLERLVIDAADQPSAEECARGADVVDAELDFPDIQARVIGVQKVARIGSSATAETVH